MEISQELFTFPFQDEKWVSRAVTGGLIALAAYIFIFAGAYLWWLILPICLYFVGLALYIPLAGYGVRSMRHVIQTGEVALPVWDDAEGIFRDGLLMAVPGFVYLLPMLIVYGLATVLFVLAGVSPLAMERYPTLGIVGLATGYAGGFMLMGCGFLVALVLGFWTFVASTRAVAENRISAAFEVGEVWTLLKAGIGPYLLSIGMMYGVAILATIAMQFLTYTIILCCVVPFLYCGFTWYMVTVTGALSGMAYRAAQAKLDATSSGPEADRPLPDMAGE